MNVTIEDLNTGEDFGLGDIIVLSHNSKTSGLGTYTGVVSSVPRESAVMLTNLNNGQALDLGNDARVQVFDSLFSMGKALDNFEPYSYKVYRSEDYELVMKQLKEGN